MEFNRWTLVFSDIPTGFHPIDRIYKSHLRIHDHNLDIHTIGQHIQGKSFAWVIAPF